MARGGKRPGQGNPGYKKIEEIEAGVRKLTPRWFEIIDQMLNFDAHSGMSDELMRAIHEDRKFALGELTKLMGKLMPTQITGKGGDPIEVTWKSKSTTNREPGPRVSITA